jgi:hypothetical protein
MQHLITLHNQLVDPTAIGSKVSSRLIGTEHVSQFDWALLLPHVEERCVAYTHKGDVAIDLTQVERYLQTTQLQGRRPIEMEVRRFDFLHESVVNALFFLGSRISQVALSPDLVDAIKTELQSPEQVRLMVQTVDTCVSFLQATARSTISHFSDQMPQKMLSEWVGEVLLLDPAVALPCTTVAREIQLQHLDALWKVLQDLQDPDPFSGVSVKYRKKLDSAMLANVQDACASLELEELLPGMKGFIQAYLMEESLSDVSTLKEVLSPVDWGGGEFQDQAWFVDHFPEQPLMQHAVDVYMTLSAMLN